MKLEKLTRWAGYIWVATIPFSCRILIWQFTPGWHEYESAWLYLNDVFLIVWLAVGSWWWLKERIKIKKDLRGWLIAGWLIAALAAIATAGLPGLALGKWLRAAAYTLAALLIREGLKREILKSKAVMSIILITAVSQGLLAITQFKIQGDVGWQILGEPVLSRDQPGVSKIEIAGAKVLRTYGTFLHPNILAGWLMLGWAAGLGMLNNEKKIKRYLVPALFIIILALILTFSRSAWLATGLATVTLAASQLKIRKKTTTPFLKVMMIAGLIVAAAIWPVGELILPRVQISAQEAAVTERMDYNRLAAKIIKMQPWGVGLGNQVYYSYQSGLYEEFNLKKAWQWQPIHNLYLLAAAETGWLGGLIWFLLTVGLMVKRIKSPGQQTAKAMLIGLIIIGLFDHFLWTIANGQAMWWLLVGLLL